MDVVRHVLSTHKTLSKDDINYVIDLIKNQHNTQIEQLICDSKTKSCSSTGGLIQFLVYADQSGICKFALSFNEVLDWAIKNKQDNKILELLNGPPELFIELYDNEFLLEDDKEFILRLISRELYSIMMTIELGNINPQKYICHEEDLKILSAKCYDEVCIQDAKILADDESRAIMSQYEKPPIDVYTIDKSSSDIIPAVYCFNTLSLIYAATSKPPINPKTNEVFSPYALKLIHDRFRKEIALFRAYRKRRNF